MLFFATISSLESPQRERAEEIFEQHGNKIYGIALSITHNKQDAEDILSEVMIKIIDNIQNFVDIDDLALKNLIVIYTRNTSINLYRKNKLRSKIMEPLTFINDDGELEDKEFLVNVSAEHHVLANERSANISAALETLTPRQKEVISLVFGAGYTYKHTAKILGISENAIALLIQRAREKLKKVLGENINEYLGKQN